MGNRKNKIKRLSKAKYKLKFLKKVTPMINNNGDREGKEDLVHVHQPLQALEKISNENRAAQQAQLDAQNQINEQGELSNGSAGKNNKPLTQNTEIKVQNVEEPSTSSTNVEPLLMEVSVEAVPRKRMPKPKGSSELKGLGEVLRKSRRQEKEEAKRKKEEERQRQLREAERKRKEQIQIKKEAKDDLLTYMNCLGELSPHYLELTAKKQRMFRQAAIMLLNEMLDEQEAEAEAA